MITTTAPRRDAGNSYDALNPTLTWTASAEIASDGTFSIASIPRSGRLQIIAVCDDWVSTTTLEGARGFFVEGQLFPVSEADMDCVVEMEQTGTLELDFVKPDGQPLAEGTASSWPNQMFYKGGSTLLGQGYESISFVRAQIEGEELQYPNESPEFPYSGIQVQAGKAVLKGLPLNHLPLALTLRSFPQRRQ